MSTLIPNENCWIGFAPDMPLSPTLTPTAAEVAAAVELTDFIISLTAGATGNAIPTPKLSSLFEPSIPGTSTAQFTSEMYRDSVSIDDIAWNALARNVSGVFYIARFGGKGAGLLPIALDHVEVWPVRVTSRMPSAMTSNTAQTFTLTCSVPREPNENALISAGA
ncbi:MAG: hypothetical protein ABI934_11715 [Actinomycetota bacterium]